MTTDRSHVLIVIPAFNEEAAVSGVIRGLLENGYSDLLVVDDCSTDATGKAATEAGARVIRLPVNLRTGGAFKTGMRWAVRRGIPCTVVQFDGDGQHRASNIERLLKGIDGGSDMVIGSRFLGSDEFKSGRTRRVGIILFSRLVSTITGVRITDVTSGFRALSWKAVNKLHGSYPSEYPDAGAVVLAHTLGLTVSEVSVDMDPRKTGKSHFTNLRSLIYPPRTVMSIVAGLLARRE